MTDTARNTKPDLSKYLSLCRTPLRNTPLYPLSRGETNHSPSLTNRKQHFKAPLSRGAGVCDVCALLPKTKAVTQNLTDNTYPKQQQKLLIPCCASHHNTPLNPLSRGETNHSNLHYQTENSISKLPVPERGNRYYNIPVFIFSTRYTGYTPRGYEGFSRRFLAGRLWCPI